MSGCLTAILILIGPRIALFVMWLATDWFHQAFDTAFWPIVGFLFMPYTTAAVMGSRLQGGGAGWVILIIIAVLIDLESEAESTKKAKKK